MNDFMELFMSAKNGDSSAMEELLHMYYPLLQAFAGIIPSAHVDATFQIYSEALRHLGKLNFMRRIAHHGHGQKPERMKFLRIIFGCRRGEKMAHLVFLLCFCIAKKRE